MDTTRDMLLEEAGQLRRELERLKDQRSSDLERVSQELTEFCYAISHELRAPIARLQGMSEALKEDCADCPRETPRIYASRIAYASRQLEQVVDSILFLSRLSRSTLTPGDVDLTGLAGQVIESLLAKGPKREVSVVLAPGLTAHADPKLMKVCLENLLGNALKFTAFSREPMIEFGVTDHNGQRTFFVRDNGAGFDMAYIDKLFIPFQHLHSQKEFPGIGIGLATVRRIVDRHGGTVWAEAVEGKGATFFFTLGSSVGINGGEAAS